MSAGFRILRRERKVDPEVVQRFARLPVANVSDSMSRLTAGGARLRPRHGGGGMAGAALTVKAAPGDNLMLHKAIALSGPGDVIVVDAGGDLTNALMGEMMLMQLDQARRGRGGHQRRHSRCGLHPGAEPTRVLRRHHPSGTV